MGNTQQPSVDYDMYRGMSTRILERDRNTLTPEEENFYDLIYEPIEQMHEWVDMEHTENLIVSLQILYELEIKLLYIDETDNRFKYTWLGKYYMTRLFINSYMDQIVFFMRIRPDLFDNDLNYITLFLRTVVENNLRREWTIYSLHSILSLLLMHKCDYEPECLGRIARQVLQYYEYNERDDGNNLLYDEKRDDYDDQWVNVGSYLWDFVFLQFFLRDRSEADDRTIRDIHRRNENVIDDYRDLTFSGMEIDFILENTNYTLDDILQSNPNSIYRGRLRHLGASHVVYGMESQGNNNVLHDINLTKNVIKYYGKRVDSLYEKDGSLYY